jgi:hypothetical protein
LIYPKFSDDNVVDDGLDLSPCVVIAGSGELEVGDAQGLDLQVLALELGPHGEFLPALPEPVSAFAKLSNHWRMMRHLQGSQIF